MTPLCYKPAWKIASLITQKKLTPSEVMRSTLDHVDRINPSLNAFIELCPEKAMEEADAMTEKITAGKKTGPLAGIPMGVKDLENASGLVTSYGSVLFKDNRVPADSVQVARLKAAGAIVVGKTNTPEFGFTGFTKNRLYGITRNPWSLRHTPGGSSGGSAAAVAGGLVPFSTGSDAGGSIRIPASYSGCFGIKPTFGRIPVGPRPFLGFCAMMVVGPLTRTVRDAALYMDCTMGYHPADPTSIPAPPESYLDRIDQLPQRLKIAYSADLGYAAVDRDILHCVENAVKTFEKMGHQVDIWQGALPDTGVVWSSLMATDIYAQLKDRWEKDRPHIGRTLAEVLEKVKKMTVEDLTAIQRLRATLNTELEILFNTYDLLLTPTMPTAAFAAEGPPPSEIDGKPIPLLGAAAFTYPFNFSGHPAASVPAGLTPAGLPVGLQIIASRFRDDLVLQASHAYENASSWDADWSALHERLHRKGRNAYKC